MRILVAEDEVTIAKALKVMLEKNKYSVDLVHNGLDALDYLTSTPYDALVLDIMMPGMDGLSVLSAARAQGVHTPALFLTAKSESCDKVLGLNTGADDYITKPFDPMEVLARVRSQLRRYTTLGAQVQQPDRYVIGGIVLDDRDKVVTVDGAPVSLTPSEYGILRLLMQNPGRVFSTAQIYEQVWNETSLGSEHSVAVHIRHLREKVEINPSDPRYIKVVWGLGYKIDKEARSE